MVSLRQWATPLTVGSFLIMGVTGTLMFFHLDSGLNKVVHEWAGWVMIAGVAAHLVLNWRALMGYFRRPVPVVIMTLSAAALGMSFITTDTATGGNPLLLVMGAVEEAPLSDVAVLAGQPLTDMLARLQEIGFAATSEMSIAEMAHGDRSISAQVLTAIFAP